MSVSMALMRRYTRLFWMYRRPGGRDWYGSGGRVSALCTVLALLTHGVNGNTPDRDGKTALMLAAFEGHTGTVYTLLAHQVQVNTQDKEGATALMLAAARGHTDVVTALLAKGADVNLQHQMGHTALMVAVVGGHNQVTHTLLAHGADLAPLPYPVSAAIMPWSLATSRMRTSLPWRRLYQTRQPWQRRCVSDTILP